MGSDAGYQDRGRDVTTGGGSGGVGFSVEWPEKEFQKLVDKTKRVVERSLKLVAAAGLANVVKETPRDTGTARRGWHVVTVSRFILKLVNRTKYLGFHVTGTGIFGPKGRPIVPRKARVLHFIAKDGTEVFARSVKGIPPNPFVDDAIAATALQVPGIVTRVLRDVGLN